jgi:hypothetical protein
VAPSSIDVRSSPPRGSSGFQDRAERLRSGRAAARSLREGFPAVTRVTVHLQFQADEAQSHADQSFVFYPGARAYFGFSCPYGDCDGIFDLTAAANSTLQQQVPRATGILECRGSRSRHRQPGQLCGLHLIYTVTAEHGPEASLAP